MHMHAKRTDTQHAPRKRYTYHTYCTCCTYYVHASRGLHAAVHGCYMDQEGTGSVRFVSVPDFSKMNRFGSVRLGILVSPVRRGSACAFQTRRGSVRFGSVPRPVPAGSGIERFGSVRLGRSGSVSYFFLMDGVSSSSVRRRSSISAAPTVDWAANSPL